VESIVRRRQYTEHQLLKEAGNKRDVAYLSSIHTLIWRLTQSTSQPNVAAMGGLALPITLRPKTCHI